MLVPDSWEKEQMPACNRRVVAADYRSRGVKRRGRAKKKKGLQGARLAASFFGPHAAMPVTASQDPRSLADCAGGLLLEEGEGR